MQKHTLKIYDTEAVIFDYTLGELKDIKVEGVPEYPKFQSVLYKKEYVEGSREMKSYYAIGYDDMETEVIVLADNINTKQLANLFLSLGAVRAVAAEQDLTNVKVIDKKEEIIKAINESEVMDTHVASVNLDDIVGHLAVEPKPKKKKAKKQD